MPLRLPATIACTAAVALATLLAAWLRLHGLTSQLVLDDEWHAIHKLMTSGYAGIAASFGYADHSIPLTLLYKAMADTVGLAEGRMRALQVTCGVALVPVASAFAWRITRDAAATGLFAVTLAVAPLLVLYSRLARPYAITTLLTVVVLAAAWRWRRTRAPRLAAAIAAAAALATWLHPIAGLFPGVALLFVFVDDVREGGRRWRGSLLLGIATLAAMALPLAWPLLHDVQSLAAKAGRDHASLETFWRMASIFAGGLPAPVTAFALLVAAWGAATIARRDRPLGAYLLVVGLVPPVVIALLGAHWSHQGHTFARYVFPLHVLLLFWASVGAISLARAAAGRHAQAAAAAAAVALAAADVAAMPTLRQVTTLGAWYGHLYHHFDYEPRFNDARKQYAGFEPPAFYRTLGRMAPGAAPIIEAPFVFAAPANAMAFFATFHRQPAKAGMLHDLCLDGPTLGEPPPRDRRFRFRDFVFLDDVDGVKASGARYLLLYREQIHARPFREGDRCLAELERRYGKPVSLDARLAVFDLRPGEPAPPAR